MTTVWTIGQSTHPIAEFLAILTANGIKRLVDIRTVPRSRHNPQFEQTTLRDVLVEQKPTAIMCAEAVPWRCHRSLVGDALLVRGVEVIDIMSATNTKPHTLTSFAVVHGTAITYPADGERTTPSD